MQPLDRATLGPRVARAIKAFIIDQRLVPDDRLPSEHELARYFQVSRIIVREALQSLATAGVVRIQHGKGTFVEPFRGGPMAEQLTFGLGDERALFRHMLELRLILEGGAIELAALRATAEDRARLHTIVEWMRDNAARGEALEEHDRAFHQAILEAAHNPALDRLGSVLDEFFRLRSLAYPPSITLREAGAEVEEHVAILAAIEGGEPERARRLLGEALVNYGALEESAAAAEPAL